MTRDEIDILWQKAMQESTKDGEMFTRYHFVKLVAEVEREACAEVCNTMARRTNDIRSAALESAAENILARGQT